MLAAGNLAYHTYTLLSQGNQMEGELSSPKLELVPWTLIVQGKEQAVSPKVVKDSKQ